MAFNVVAFLLFLLVNLLIGVYGSRRSTTLQEYALGSKGFHTSTIVASIIIVSYGGGLFYNDLNLAYLLLLTSNAWSYFVVANVLSRRLTLFFDSLSIAEVMGKLYGKHIRTVTALCSTLSDAIASAVHLKVFAMVIASTFSLPMLHSLLFATAFIVVLLQLGGMRSLTLVSLVRNLALVCFLPTFAWFLWKFFIVQGAVKSLDVGLAVVHAWRGFFQSDATGAISTAVCLLYAIPTLYPAQVQCMLLSNNGRQVQRAFNYAGLFSVIINLFLIWVSILLQMNGTALSVSATQRALTQHVGLQALFAISAAALSMSTAGAHIHSATVSVANDLLYGRRFKGISLACPPQRYAIPIGLIGMCFACYAGTPLELLLLGKLLFKPIVSVPLFLGLLGVHLSRRVVSVAMAVGALTIFLWPLYTHGTATNGLLPAVVAHIATLVGGQVFYLKSIKKTNYQLIVAMMAREKSATFWERCKNALAKLLDKTKKMQFVSYMEAALPRERIYCVFFSFYIIITSYGAFYAFADNLVWRTRLEALVLFPALIVASFFLVYASVVPSRRLVRFAAWMWQLSTLYFLYFAEVGVLFLTGFSHLQLATLFVSLCFSILGTPGLLLFARLLITLLLAFVLVPHLDHKVSWLHLSLELNVKLLYSLFMMAILLAGLVFYKQKFNKLTTAIQALDFVQDLEEERRFFKEHQIAKIAHEADCILAEFQKTGKKSLAHTTTECAHFIQAQTTTLRAYFAEVFSYLRQSALFQTEPVSIAELFQGCFKQMQLKAMGDYPYIVVDTEHAYIRCSAEDVKTLIVNSLKDCRQAVASVLSVQAQDVFIYVSDTHLEYPLLYAKSQLQKVEAIGLVVTTATQKVPIQSSYTVSQLGDPYNATGASRRDQVENNVYMENQNITNMHHGYSEVLHTDMGITHLYVLPVDPQLVSKHLVSCFPMQADGRAAANLEEEEQFLEKVQQKSWLDLDLVQQTIDFIKPYYAPNTKHMGQAFCVNPIGVATILLDLTEDPELILAALTHDVVRYSFFTQRGLAVLIGEPIVQIVCAAASLERRLPPKEADCLAYTEQVLAWENPRVLLLALAFFVQKIRTVEDGKDKIKNARYVNHLYGPLAAKMQLTDLANELYAASL